MGWDEFAQPVKDILADGRVGTLIDGDACSGMGDIDETGSLGYPQFRDLLLHG
jgi:hypothetical protein